MIARKSLVIFISQVLQILFGVVTTKITLLLLPPEVFGMFGYALALTTIFLIFSDLNFSQVFFKRIAEGKDLCRNFSAFVTIRFILVAFSFLCFVAYLLFLFFSGKGVPIFHYFSFVF